MGYYASVSELQSAVPSPAVGDAYGVGASEPYHIYIWGGASWVDTGRIQGPAGPQLFVRHLTHNVAALLCDFFTNQAFRLQLCRSLRFLQLLLLVGLDVLKNFRALRLSIVING